MLIYFKVFFLWMDYLIGSLLLFSFSKSQQRIVSSQLKMPEFSALIVFLQLCCFEFHNWSHLLSNFVILCFIGFVIIVWSLIEVMPILIFTLFCFHVKITLIKLEKLIFLYGFSLHLRFYVTCYVNWLNVFHFLFLFIFQHHGF